MDAKDESDSESFLHEAEKALKDLQETAPEGRFTRERWKRVLGGLMVVVVVGVLLYFGGQVTTLTCDRGEMDRVNCAIESKWLGLVRLREQSVLGVQGAQVGEHCDEDGCAYRVELRTDAGIVPLTFHYSSGSALRDNIARQVNDFVQDPTAASLQVREHFDPSSLIVPAIVAVGILLFFRTVRLRFGPPRTGGSFRSSGSTRPPSW